MLSVQSNIVYYQVSTVMATCGFCAKPCICETSERLTQKALEHYSETRLTEEDQKNRNMIFQRLCREVMRIAPAYKLCEYGSSVNGFCDKDSDMDLSLELDETMIFLYPFLMSTTPPRLEQLRLLGKHFRRTVVQARVGIVGMVVLMKAKKPLIKLTIKIEDQVVDVDLSCHNQDAQCNSRIVRIFTGYDSRVNMLYCLLKRWAKMHSLHGGSNSGLNSYSLVILTIKYLQVGVSPPILPTISAEDLEEPNRIRLAMTPNYQTVGRLFIGMLRFYRDFEFKRKVIDIRTKETINRNLIEHNSAASIYINCVGGGKTPSRSLSPKNFQKFQEVINGFCSVLGTFYEPSILVGLGFEERPHW